MKSRSFTCVALLGGAFLMSTPQIADSREFGVRAGGFGGRAVYTGPRGGSAYVGPRGAAFQGAEGRTAVSGVRGAAYSGPNVNAVSGRYGGAAVVGENAAAVRRPVVAPLPAGYIRTLPLGAAAAVYRGYNCLYVGGIYYRPVIYGGETVYVVVE